MKIVHALITATGLMVACEDQGPFERAGEEVDEAIEDARNGGETVGNRLDEARDEAEDVADELEN